MTRQPIPPAALWLGLAGLLPFVWGAASAQSEPLAAWGLAIAGPRLTGVPLVLGYGVIILSFMSGVLWGFAAKQPKVGAIYYIFSVLPALWGLFLVGGDLTASFAALGLGYVGLLALDWLFATRGFAPGWWMPLRLLLTSIVLACLTVAALA
ncbi:DUF3429 domain-containing protein [Cypionkella sp.]|jgi:hypothetical protein|uniref:DUF3429 domain-containing protein n=1 Tax=Cypionkella sp. TaxID=2811411 RepID=UPI003751EDE1